MAAPWPRRASRQSALWPPLVSSQSRDPTIIIPHRMPRLPRPDARIVDLSVGLLPTRGPVMSSRNEVLCLAVVESRPCTLEDIDQVFVDVRGFDSAHGVDHGISGGPVDMRMNDLLGVAHDRDVGTVSYHNDLPPLLDVLDNRNQKPVDRLAVQVFLRLVNDDRLVALVDEKIEHQEKCSTLAR